MRDPIAIVSMACRFPGADTTQQFWEHLMTGYDALSDIPKERFDASLYYDPVPATVGKCATRKGYFLDDVKHFDASFFKIKPHDAEVMDPQQRILLELCAEAFASVKLSRESLSAQRIGVFMGITKSDYKDHVSEALLAQHLKQKTVVTGILENLIAARIANYFDLTGPALTLDTACSSSLVALHMAKESIASGTCDMALVGGINLNLDCPAFLGMSAAGALSPADHYAVFDAHANGFFMGEGGGVLLLVSQSQAKQKKLPVLGLLKGSAVNNDGRSISPMAPRSSTQQAAIIDACQDANITPDTIDYIEAHGTGTALGDAVEAQTLNAVFKNVAKKPILGTVKPNIGHLLSAAGMGSLIKTLLCFQHRQFPPLLHYKTPREQLHLDEFTLNTEPLTFAPENVKKQMVAGINSFGFGGTNAHIILEAPVQTTPFKQAVLPYHKQAYWVDLLSTSNEATPQTITPNAQVKAFTSQWFETPIPAQTPTQPQHFILFSHVFHTALKKELGATLTQQGHTCTYVEDLQEAERFLSKGDTHDHWVLLLPAGPKALYNFLRSLEASTLANTCRCITVVTQRAISKSHTTSPQRKPFATERFLETGLIQGFESELTLPVYQLDLEHHAEEHTEKARQINNIAIALTASEPPLQRVLNLDRFWQKSRKEISLYSDPPLPKRIKHQGIYLITGGGSGLGAAIAHSMVKRLSTGESLTLIIAGRRPEKSHTDYLKLKERIKALGSAIYYYTVDVTQASEVAHLCQHIHTQHGKIDGVVHAAGTVNPGDFRKKSYDSVSQAWAPKVKGLKNLDNALNHLLSTKNKNMAPDFFVAFSSLSSALPGYGRGLIDYVAGNVFMDQYATQSHLPVQVLQWGPWKDTGMAAHPAMIEPFKKWGIEALSTQEGTDAFHEFIDAKYTKALILKTQHDLRTLRSLRPKKSQQRVSRPQIETVVESTDLESRLLALIQKTLSEIGENSSIKIDDNLMDMGLDSLSAIDLTKTLGEWGYEDLPFELFFEQQSIRALAHYLNEKSVPVAEQTKTEPAVTPKKPETLSHIQRSFFMAQTLYERPNYSYFKLTLDHEVSQEHIQAAFTDLIHAHPQLRAQFHQNLTAKGLELTQQILPAKALQPEQFMVTCTEENAFVNQRFDLSTAPLFRIGTHQDKDQHHLMFLFHHIIFDGVSMKNILQEFWEHLQAIKQKRAYAPPSLKTTYADYIQVQQNYRKSEDFAKDLSTFQTQFSASQLPENTTFFKALSSRYASLGDVPASSLQRHLDLALANNLVAAATQHQVPLQMVYLSAFYEALAKWTAQNSLWINIAIAGRQWPLPDIHKVVGSFADLFPLHYNVSLQNNGTQSLFARAKILRQRWNKSKSLHRLGSDTLQPIFKKAAVDIPFSFSFVHFDNAWMSQADQAHVLDSQMRGYHAKTQFGLLVSENPQGFYYSVNSPEGLFTPAELEAFCELFEEVLSGGGNPPEISPQAPNNFWAAFEAVDHKSTALYEGSKTSYKTLKTESLQLANALKKQGIKAGSVLGYQGGNSNQSVQMLLACLALGATWVPMDTSFPAERVAFICHTAKVDLLVLENSNGTCGLKTQLETRLNTQIQTTEALKNAPNENVVLPVANPQGIAYIIFTSGSTGQPKGVPITYKALMLYMNWAVQNLDYAPTDNVMWANSIAFDASLRPVLATLMTGGCIYPVPADIKQDAKALLTWLNTHQITCWSSVPTLWKGLIQALEMNALPLPHLRQVQLGGEALPASWAKRWQALYDVPLVNLYGPTENTINTTYHCLKNPVEDTVPIGTPLPYVNCLVMNERSLQPVEKQQKGELWISGPTVTEAYITNKEIMNDERFVNYEGKRYYRTGDRVYRDGQGLFHYVDRLDRQVNLRGYRIELAEIENAFLNLANIQSAHVTCQTFPSGSTQIMAQIVLEHDPAKTKNHEALTEAFAKELAKTLPPYMLPDHIEIISKLPQLATGKKDLKGLQTQSFLTQLWKDLLHLPQLPENADFFKLGGDSLLLMQGYMHLQNQYSELPKIAWFHQHRHFDAWVEQLKEAKPRTQNSAETRNTARQPHTFALSPSQLGFYLWNKHLKTDVSLFEAQLMLEGPLDKDRFKTAVFEAAAQHQMLNVSLKNTSPPVFEKTAEPNLLFCYHALKKDEHLADYLDTLKTFNGEIFDAPLLQCYLIKITDKKHLWLIQSHHILADGLSCLILGRDIFEAYNKGQSYSHEKTSPALFSDYVTLRKAEQKQHGSEHLRYWQRVFRKPYASPNLRVNSVSQQAGFKKQERKIPQHALQAFKQICQSENSTLFMGILKAYTETLIAHTKQPELIVGLAHHGRDYALKNIHGIFGCFARTLPLRLSLPIALNELQQNYTRAAEHPMDPIELMRSLPKGSALQQVMGTQFFMSYVNFSDLNTAIPEGVSINWQDSSTHFAPSNQDTDFFMAVKAHPEHLIFTLNYNTLACSDKEANDLLDNLLALLGLPMVQKEAFDIAKTGPLDAVLINYLPALSHIQRLAPQLSAEHIQKFKDLLFKNKAVLWSDYTQTPLGKTGSLTLPYFAEEIQPSHWQKTLAPAVESACKQAHEWGAKHISLAGMLPALASYGKDLNTPITTGHTTTVVAMLKNISFALKKLNRQPKDCDIAVVGMGSIGEATLFALISTLDTPPRSILIVDRTGHEKRLETLAERLHSETNYTGTITYGTSKGDVPESVYDCNLILGAVSGAPALNIEKLKPQTCVVDDSFPHCFDVKHAIQRMKEQQDVLIVGGGLLQLPNTKKQVYLPLPVPELQQALFQSTLPHCLPGCQLESLLLASHPELPPTLGLVKTEHVLAYLKVIDALGIQAAPLHLEGFIVGA